MYEKFPFLFFLEVSYLSVESPAHPQNVGIRLWNESYDQNGWFPLAVNHSEMHKCKIKIILMEMRKMDILGQLDI